jgi:hypothetical protein
MQRDFAAGVLSVGRALPSCDPIPPRYTLYTRILIHLGFGVCIVN